jgi:hypothetical protein
MRPQILRWVVVLATFVVAWLVLPRVALAASGVQAPICDPRGAITFAPPPQAQDPDSSLDIVWSDDDCTKSPLEQRNVMPERTPPNVVGGTAIDTATLAPSVLVAAPPSERLPAPDATDLASRPGFRTSLERPPRA